MKRLLLLLLAIATIGAQDNWIYYNKTTIDNSDHYSIWRINENGQNDTLIFNSGYLLDVSEDGNYLLLVFFRRCSWMGFIKKI